MLLTADLSPQHWTFVLAVVGREPCEVVAPGLLLVGDVSVQVLDVLARQFGLRVVEPVGEA